MRPLIAISSISLLISDLSRFSEHLLNSGLQTLSPITLFFVFIGGLLTSLGPCSLSLLPITVAYLAGFSETESPFNKSISFCSGIVFSLVLLGSLSGFVGSIYGQLPVFFPTLVAVVAIFMGLNLLGIFTFPLPAGPDPNIWKTKVPKPLAPISAGFAFGLAASPCTTPVLAVLLTWIAQNGNPFTGILLLTFFAFGQIIPLLLAGTFAASIPKILALRSIGSWIPPISGMILVVTGVLTLLSRWI